MSHFKFAFRQLLKNPGFTIVAVVTLALGIGANTTIFSIINTILFKPLNVPHPEQLVGIYQHEKDNPDSFALFSYADFNDLRSGQESGFTDLFAFGVASVGLQGDLTERLSANLVSGNYFSALGVAPALGRVFLPEEETSGAGVVVLSDSLWRRLGADPSLVGRKLRLTRTDVTVVGVMPRGFTGSQLNSPALFLPIGIAGTLTSAPGQPPAHILTDRSDRRLMLLGRLRPGLTRTTADAALSVLNRSFTIPDPADPKPRILACWPPSRFNFGNYPDRVGKALAPLASFAFALSALVLGIACLNLANMMLARGAAHRKEIAVRLALGAGRRRILSQLLTEGFLLAVLGGSVGLLVSVWATNLLASFVTSGMPADFPRFDLSPDWRVLLTLLVLCGLATIFFALGPAWKLARLDPNSDLKRHASEDGRAPGARRFGTRELLAVGQIAGALALLVAAALFSRSAINVAEANPGFQFGSNFYLSLDSSLAGYSVTQEQDLVRTALARLSALPGVESVSLALNIPFGESSWGRGVQLGGAPPPSGHSSTLADGKELGAMYNIIGADYFRTIGLPLQEGREFEPREVETTNSQRVAIISRNLADELWPGQDPLGHSIQFPSEDRRASPILMTVVGVVPAINWQLFSKERPAEVYVPLGQDFQPDLKLHVRVAPGANAAGLMAAARGALHQLDPRIPVTEVKTLARLHRDGANVRIARLGSMLFGGFGGLAMLLSLLGIYGIKAYAVARRTREIGIRMALGATAPDVVVMILRETVWLAGLGLGVGLFLAIAVGKLAGSYLYQVPAMDPLTYAVIPPLLLGTVLAACAIPARRAAKLDPMRALRYE